MANRNTYQEEKKVGLFVKMDKTSFIASPNCFADLTISTQYILTNNLPRSHAMPSNLLWVQEPMTHTKSNGPLENIPIEGLHKKSCGYLPELLSIEPNNLVVSWWEICDNPLTTIMWGQILSKDNNFVSPSYLLCLSFVLSLFFLYYFVYYSQKS